jgi:hypothetical protein
MNILLQWARAATPADVAAAFHHPWLWAGGRSYWPAYPYYRPVMMAIWYAEYHLFGEHNTPWQVVSLLVHVGSCLLFLSLLSRIFVSPLAGLAGTLAWGLRHDIRLVIEWTPAQTDLFATLFVLAGLLAVKLFLDQGAKKWLVGAVPLMLLAMFCKEVAYPAPLLAVALIVHSTGLARPQRAALVAGALALFALVLAWRTWMLHGTGFLPGGTPDVILSARGLTAIAMRWSLLLLPYSLLPRTTPGGWVALLAAATVVLAFLCGRKRWWAGVFVFIAGMTLVTMASGGPVVWFNVKHWRGLGTGLFCLGAAGLVLWRRPREAALTAAWGLLAVIPVYHIFYNPSGNLTHLPFTCWGLAWASLVAALLPRPAGARPFPGDGIGIE